MLKTIKKFLGIEESLSPEFKVACFGISRSKVSSSLCKGCPSKELCTFFPVVEMKDRVCKLDKATYPMPVCFGTRSFLEHPSDCKDCQFYTHCMTHLYLSEQIAGLNAEVSRLGLRASEFAALGAQVNDLAAKVSELQSVVFGDGK